MANSEILAAIRWWAVLMVIGALAFPLTYRLLHRLPDRGYAFVKMTGLLVVAYLFWLLGSLGFLNNSLGAILVALFTLSALSFWVLRTDSRNRLANETENQDLGAIGWLRENWRYVLAVELLFAIMFGVWIWVRAQNPTITGTEKPMEFAFLNSIGRSSSFPPLDPWLSGFGISYYYFGYVMTSVLVRLAAVPEQIAFNLAIAWLVAGTALGAFGVVYNLIAAQKDTSRVKATIFGFVAAIAIAVAGNSEMLLELLYANDIGSEGFWTWLDIRDLNEPPGQGEEARYQTAGWWWWRSSRVIHEYHLSGVPEEGLEPIVETPAFSFVLGDLHAHVLSLPFAFLSLAVAFSWWLNPDPPIFDLRKWFTRRGFRYQFATIKREDLALFLFTILVLGGLSFLNTWDVLIHLVIVVGAYLLARWRTVQVWSRDLLFEAFTLAMVLSLLAIISYLPFYLGFRSQAGAPFLLPMAMQPTRLAHALTIFVMPLSSILLLVGSLIVWSRHQPKNLMPRRPWIMASALTVALIIGLFILMLVLGWVIAVSPEGEGRIVNLAKELNLGLAPLPGSQEIGERITWATSAVGALAPTFLSARLGRPALVLLLSFLVAAVIFLLIRFLNKVEETEDRPQRISTGESLPFALLLIGTATVLVLVPEFVYLRDNFGQRVNTIFKFYYQAWVFFGIAAVFALDYLLRRFRTTGIIVTVWYGTLLLVALLFPVFAVQSRAIEYRGQPTNEFRRPATLDGLANRDPAERDALLWLRENMEGTPVIVEAVGGQYSDYGRVASATGLPTLLGWAGHEYQWRGYTDEPSRRDPVIRTIYSPGNWDTTAQLLDDYNVSLIYFGSLERQDFGPRAQEKLSQNLEVAYSNESVTIYRWQPKETP